MRITQKKTIVYMEFIYLFISIYIKIIDMFLCYFSIANNDRCTTFLRIIFLPYIVARYFLRNVIIANITDL